MIFHFNPQDVLSAAWTVLNSDSTLKGSTYLTASKRVFTNRAPNENNLPFIVIDLPMWVPSETQQYQGEMRIFAYVGLLANGQPDFDRGNKILSRIDELLNNMVLSVSGATMHPLYSLGLVPTMFDTAADNSKARGVARYRVSGGKSG